MTDELFTNYHELESSRLLLRRITMQDLDDVFEIYSNKEVMLYFADRFPFEKSTEAETMIREYEEALSLIINHAFGCSDVNRIEAMVEPPNTGSRVLLEKLGFQYEGTLRKHEMCRGDFVDIQMFSILREDRKLGGTYGIE